MQEVQVRRARCLRQEGMCDVIQCEVSECHIPPSVPFVPVHA
jgi:hypothetical protein